MCPSAKAHSRANNKLLCERTSKRDPRPAARSRVESTCYLTWSRFFQKAGSRPFSTAPTDNKEINSTRRPLLTMSRQAHDVIIRKYPRCIATISAGFEKGDFLVREEKGQRVYFDFFEEASFHAGRWCGARPAHPVYLQPALLIACICDRHSIILQRRVTRGCRRVRKASGWTLW